MSTVASECRCTVRKYSNAQLRRYIGRHIIRVVVANDQYTKKTGESMLSPAMRTALRQMWKIAQKQGDIYGPLD